MIIEGLMLLALGIALLFFGLLLFNALQVIFYVLVGAAGGAALANYIDPAPPAWLSLACAVAGAIVFGLLFQFVKGLALALLGALLGLVASGQIIRSFFLLSEPVVKAIVVVVTVLVFVLLAAFVVDIVVIIGSAIIGSNLTLSGLAALFPEVSAFKGTVVATGNNTPWIVALVITILGIGYQFSQRNNWFKPS